MTTWPRMRVVPGGICNETATACAQAVPQEETIA